MQLNGYHFEGGFPTLDTIRKAYDDADLIRAVEAYKFFYPTVAFTAGFLSLKGIGIATNGGAAVLQGSPKQLVYTPNSDTPYAIIPLDLRVGPIRVELPAGPLVGVVNDLNQRYVMDLGLAGLDGGGGGRHLILPPDFGGIVPQGFFAAKASTYRVLLVIRAIPERGNIDAAIRLIKSVAIRPLERVAEWTGMEWTDITDREWDSTPASFENTLRYWELLHDVIDNEPPFEPYRAEYGDLAALGIAKGRLFAPDERMDRILAEAAVIANAQMRVQAFADRRRDRVVWNDRRWEWVSLRPENGTFDTPSYKDLEAREKWFYQATVESPAMFRRDAGAGSLYWLGTRDNTGAYLDGAKTYKLSVPQPVPARLFWSVTIYDPDSRSEIRTDQNKAALRSLVELKGANGKAAELFFGPTAPAGTEDRWIKTIPGKGWFTYFRIYGPDKHAFDATWKPGDFEQVRVGESRPS